MLQIVRGLLPEPVFAVAEQRVATEASSIAAEVPEADMYVVEAHPRPGSTAAVVGRILGRFPSAPICVVGEALGEGYAFPLMQLRVRGFVTYSDAPAQLARAVEALSDGGFWISRSLLTRFLEATVATNGRARGGGAAGELTYREQEVLNGLLQNLSNKEIAKDLRITERGVKFHVSNLLAKHKVRRRSDLILLFLAHGGPLL
ncbi:MAG: LuxR C-terminal-related transcriptional regulator [Thermoanaerobaculia bacterium]